MNIYYMGMDNNKMDIQELISYVHQLQTQNKELQKHIFNVQQQLDEKNEAIILINQKKEELSDHIRKCEDQIIKRQARQLSLIENIEALNKEIDIYVQQINRLRKQIPTTKDKDKDKEKDETEVQKINATPRLIKMPPKSHQKCKSCEALSYDRDMLFVELQKERERCYVLSRDIECLIGTFCES